MTPLQRALKEAKTTNRFGYALTKIRKSTGETQSQAAEAVGIAQQTYAGYECGKHCPNLFILIELANHFNCSLDDISGRYDN